ncbi:MAG TPA: macro domain-containing protein [Marmoricola sp.]|nr:macro domain-containing protein [Marmoricola sp.]
MELEVVQADITRLSVDAIVNAANTRMRGGGGVDGAIHRAAGPALLDECRARFPSGLATGEAGWTTGQRLPASWVIHVVGPVYDGTGSNRSQLVSCYRNALAVADELMRAHREKSFSVAFPLVSAGVYGWPRSDAVEVQVSTLASTRTRVTRCLLVGFDSSAASMLRDAVARLG